MKVSEKGICHICDEVFEDAELKEINGLFLCSEHFDTYLKSDWIAFRKTVVTADNANDALLLQELKDQLKVEGKPSFILSNYEQSDSGAIQTISILYVPKTN